MKLVLFGVFGVAFLVMNPFYFVDDEFNFDARDLRDAVEGTWQLEVHDKRYTLTIEQAQEPTSTPTSATSFVPSAHACGDRTLVKSAHACIRFTKMPLLVQTLTTRGEGVLSVEGMTFQRGELAFSIDHVAVTAKISPAGVATEVSNGATLTRIFP